MQELEAFSRDLEDLLPKLRQARRAALEDAGDQMLAAVRSRIGGSGKVQRWQESHLGSGGGYVAVRARAKVYDENRCAVGYITNALESGHWQTPGQYVPALGRKLTRDRVPGKYMYAQSAPDLERIAQSAAERIEASMEHILEG